MSNWVKTGHPVWKYKLTRPIVFAFEHDRSFWFDVGWEQIESEYFLLTAQSLMLKPSYACNGLTGFFDIKSALDAAGFHDCLLNENSKGIPDLRNDRAYAPIHRVFRDKLRHDNGWLMTNILYQGVRVFHPLTL